MGLLDGKVAIVTGAGGGLGREHALAALALACGYYEQSHFIADFRAFSGMTPRQFVQTTNMSFLELA